MPIFDHPQLSRMEKRIGRATRHGWSGFFVLTIVMLVAGTWIGYAFHATFYGMLVALGVDVICVGYAWIVAPWQVRRSVRAERGRFPKQEEHVKQLLAPLCEKAGIQMPEIFIIPAAEINAFAAGFQSKRQYIGVTVGTIEFLTDRELTAVLAHEVSHIFRKDTLFEGWWVALMGVITGVTILLFVIGVLFASTAKSERNRQGTQGPNDDEQMGWFVALASVIVGVISIVIIQLWLKADSRRREVLADEHSVLLMGSAKPLASALERMKNQTFVLQVPSTLAMFFAVTPTRRSWWERLFDTHPDIDWRIQKLRSIAQAMGEL